MRRALGALALVVLLSGIAHAAEDGVPGAAWEHVAPTAAGWSEAGLAEARDWSERMRTSALLIVQHGRIVADWGDTAARFELASVRKSFLSALIGIAVAEKTIDLDSTMGALGIDDNAPGLSQTEKGATVRMLLEARSGIYHPALYETPGMAKARPRRYSHAPGTFWYYNNWDFNALGTIYEHATGRGIYEALADLIARPIGMQDYRPEDGHYVSGPDSIHRAYPLRMSARDLARFALLYLHEGRWGGRQLVPAAWVRESTRAYSTTDYGSGYGYLWWIARPGIVPAGTYFAAGYGGQYAFVVPADDLVIVRLEDRDAHLPEPRRGDLAQLMRLILKAGGLAPQP